jgi:hypothetical protein
LREILDRFNETYGCEFWRIRGKLKIGNWDRTKVEHRQLGTWA